MQYLKKIIISTFIGIIIFIFGIMTMDVFPLALTAILLFIILIYMAIISYNRAKIINKNYKLLWAVGSMLPIINIFIINKLSKNILVTDY